MSYENKDGKFYTTQFTPNYEKKELLISPVTKIDLGLGVPYILHLCIDEETEEEFWINLNL